MIGFPGDAERLDEDADWLAWIRTNPGTDRRRLLALLDAAQSDLFESKAEVDARDAEIRERDAEIIELQDALAEKDKALADIVTESVGRLNALAESRAEVARLQSELADRRAGQRFRKSEWLR